MSDYSIRSLNAKQKELFNLVTSSCLCKYAEGAGFTFQVEALEDGIDDAVHAFNVDKANHGTSPATHLDETALDDIGGA